MHNNYLEGSLLELLVILGSGEGVGIVIGSSLLVHVDAHGPISLIVLHARPVIKCNYSSHFVILMQLIPVRTVDRELQVVGSQPVPMGVGVGEQAALKQKKYLYSVISN